MFAIYLLYKEIFHWYWPYGQPLLDLVGQLSDVVTLFVDYGEIVGLVAEFSIHHHIGWPRQPEWGNFVQKKAKGQFNSALIPQ